MRHNPGKRPQPAQQAELRALSDLPGGAAGVVHMLSAGKDLAARLASLGITPGVEIAVVQNYGRGPLVVMVRDTRLALGRGEAYKVLVEVR